ncbi:MAG: metallophosphoesterase [Lysobacterales bacterium]|nr:MAG: metallophosphoesterase [Xanthomonadales bacterium]
MKLVCTSDTHMGHHALGVPEADVLIHAGDFTRRGSRAEATGFLDWLAWQPATHKLLIAGNHDLCCEQDSAWFANEAAERAVVLLLDSEVVIDGVRFWGSPMTPRFRNMAFNRERGTEIRAHWDKIPHGVDVLITHGPPRGIGDRMFLGAHVGCDDLRERVAEIQPAVHVFGHIHEAFGEHADPGKKTRFLNVACARFLSYGRRNAVELDV